MRTFGGCTAGGSVDVLRVVRWTIGRQTAGMLTYGKSTVGG